MKVVIAIDSLKGSLSSMEAGEAIKAGILDVFKETTVKILPLADGGEGTVEALVEGMDGQVEILSVTGPLGEKVNAHYGLIPHKNMAIIEMAQAAGLPLVPTEERNPLKTTTYGVGELIKDAIVKGSRHFIIGIGGSSTNDAGLGMLQALGFEFYDENQKLVGNAGRDLERIRSFSTENALSQLKECHFKIACDVNNPLFGPKGAAYVYGPQKGATEEIVESLDAGLRNFSNVVDPSLADVSGTGAAGGLGYAFVSLLRGSLEPGIDIIMNEIRLEEELKNADFVITGEGRMDFQTSMGKAPIGVAKLAKKHHVKVIGLAGSVTEDATACNDAGIDSFFSIQNNVIPLEEAMKKDVAAKNMKATTVQIFNLIKALQ